ncbi:hypothetical protein FVE85_4894 [Porphyridium purpureum]|uniref:DEK-C domain-containing protein n=1 Tax=Porphyridium purpureum TaxID=35688 RepID=A0A5J4YTH4_PORPP|nr:hypothetical protein FVE85_4894 [Porphyridium purpureum]|eukprot:POR8714..scf236_6
MDGSPEKARDVAVANGEDAAHDDEAQAEEEPALLEKRVSKRPKLYGEGPGEAVVSKAVVAVVMNETGTSLGENEELVKAMGKLHSSADLLKVMHRMLYGTPGKESTRKREIRSWRGIAAEDADGRAKLAQRVGKVSISDLRAIAKVCKIKKSSAPREELCNECVAYFMTPVAMNGRKVTPVKKASNEKAKSGSARRSRSESKSKKKRAAEAGASSSAEDDEESGADERVGDENDEIDGSASDTEKNTSEAPEVSRKESESDTLVKAELKELLHDMSADERATLTSRRARELLEARLSRSLTDQKAMIREWCIELLSAEDN